MKLRCRFGWHDWERWKHCVLMQSILCRAWEETNGQSRVCKDCGVEELRT